MGTTPLDQIGVIRSAEGALESAVPLGLAGTALYWLQGVLGAPATGRPYSGLELAVLLMGVSALSAWAAARQAGVFGKTGARFGAGTGAGAALIAVLTVRSLAVGGFEGACADQLGGAVVRTAEVTGGSKLVCQVHGTPSNPYLPGALIAPAWSGEVSTPLWLLVLASGGLTGLGHRDRRLRRSHVPEKVLESLWLKPAAGLDAALGEPAPKGANIVACGNPTLWGDLCGQIYSAEKAWEPGEWCVRCQQVFRPAERTLRLHVVSLCTGDIDVLNSLERLDTLSWRQGEPMPPDARISGQERWVELGTVDLPDVLSAATALSLIHAELPRLAESGDDAVKAAVKLAEERASRLCAWIWRGRFPNRLTYARPTNEVRFAVGPARLRDLVPDSGDELTLQLDIGLLPLELRTGFVKSFVDAGRSNEVQNSRFDLWIPVAPPNGAEGLWVDRLEGEALRAWLGTERIRASSARGVSSPLPYRHEGPPASEGRAALDLALIELDRDGQAPTGERHPGDSVAEWAWLDADQIELLRRRALVQVEGAS